MVTFPGSIFSSSRTIEEWIALCEKNGVSVRNKNAIDKLIKNNVAVLEKYVNDRGCLLYFSNTHYILSSTRVARRKTNI